MRPTKLSHNARVCVASVFCRYKAAIYLRETKWSADKHESCKPLRDHILPFVTHAAPKSHLFPTVALEFMKPEHRFRIMSHARKDAALGWITRLAIR